MALFFYFILFVCISIYFNSVDFYNTHQVLVGLPQGVGALAFSFSFLFILVYFHNKHQVLVGLPQGVGGLAGLFLFYFIFILFYFILLRVPGACRAPPRGWWPCYFILFI